ncbi:RDD family protein [Nonomuraea guangzhouensis]|uniref:RDD family protein n=2 Tax=Nonomuraea guangzhouensis TaxID=1291555 RepID=A0ABW4G0D3_9ACTN|nr:RDD family protein [Nonomuraea guangzhouensis]
MEITAEGALPALVVLLGLLACLARRDSGVAARRVAGLLVLISVTGPLVSPYRDSICPETIPLLSSAWFRAMAGAWGITQLCLLMAAVLVLAASRAMRPSSGEEPVPSQTGLAWRRAAAALADYLIVTGVLGIVVGPLWAVVDIGPGSHVGYGLLEHVGVFQSSVRPADLAIPSGLFLYFWVPHALWGRTLGKRLLGVRVVAAGPGGRLGAGRVALRTMAFPLLAFVPGVGLLCLFADGLWTLIDPEGRVLHDRWLGTAVVRDRVKNAQPQT